MIRVIALCLIVTAAESTAQSGWSRRSPQNQPTRRGYHSLVYDAGRQVTVLFGGWDGAPLADTWEWDGTNWKQRQLPKSPQARCCYAISYDLSRQRVVLFGGTDGSTADWNDTWEYDGKTWVEIIPNTRPIPRRAHRMAFDILSRQTVLFGGGKGAYGTPRYADTWTWDGKDWTQHFPATVPMGRWQNGLASDLHQGGVILFGGGGGSTIAPVTLNDMWRWDGINWQPQPSTNPPSPRLVRGMVHDLRTRNVVMLGDTSTPGHTWTHQNGSWREDARSPRPATRTASGMAYDLARSRTVLFGGFNSAGYRAGTWEYDSIGRADWVAYGSGCASSAGTPQLLARGSGAPVVGSSWSRELRGFSGTGPAALGIGLSYRSWNGNPLPFNLSVFGMTGCMLYASPDVVVGLIVNNGIAVLTTAIPNDPQLVGRRFFEQAYVLERGSNPLGVIVSNAGAGTIGVY